MNITHRRWFLPAALALVTLIYFRHLIFLADGTGLAGSDFRQFVYPIMQFMVRSIREDGIIPLWNPHQFLGYSVLGNPQYILFYAPNWILLAFPGEAIFHGIALSIALHGFWSSWGMASLARAWGARPIPALLAGIVFAFGDFPAARLFAGHYTLLLAMAWFPWILYTFRMATRSNERRWVIWGGLALAMQIFAGHPQITFLTGIALVMQWAYEMLTPENHKRVTQQLVLLIGLGAVLSAVSWLPILDYNDQTVRGADDPSLEFVNEFAIPSTQLSTLIVPDLYGNPLDPPEHYFGRNFFEEMTVYIGLLPLLMVALVFVVDRREAWFFAAIAVVALLMSIGLDGGIQVALYRWVPLADGFRAAGRAMILLMMALANLMALMLTHLMDASHEERRRILKGLVQRVLPVLLVMIFGAALVYTAFDESPRGNYRAEKLATAGIFLALTGFALWLWTRDTALRWALLVTAVVLVLDVWRVSWVIIEPTALTQEHIWREASIDVPTDVGRVIQLPPIPATPNGASWTGHYSLQGYDPLAPSGWARLFEKLGDNPSPANPIYSITGVRYLLAPIPLEAYGYEDVENFELIGLRAPFAFYENTVAPPRTFLAETYAVEPNDALARERILSGERVLLERDPGCDISGAGGAASITDYTPNHVTVSVEAEGSSLLVLSDQYDEDWRARVNGESAEILRVNTAMRGVCVPDGDSVVEFSYRPRALVVGGVISGVGWAALLVLVALKRAINLKHAVRVKVDD